VAFEDLLKTIADETDRAGVEQLAKKYPVLKEAGDILDKVKAAQPHLSRLKELTGREFDPAGAAKFAADWQGWAADQWDRENNATKSELATKALLDQAQARIAELEQLGASDVTIEEMKSELNKALTEAGVVTKKDLPTLLPMDRLFDKEGKPRVATMDDVSGWTNGLAGRFQEAFAELTPEVNRHFQTFGEYPDLNKVFSTMLEEQKAAGGRPVKPLDAYRKTYSEQFAAKEKEAMEKKIADAKAEGIAEGKKAVQQSTGGRAIPIDSRGGLAMGAVARRVQAKIQKDADGKTIEAPLGRGIIAAKAAEEFLAKQA